MKEEARLCLEDITSLENNKKIIDGIISSKDKLDRELKDYGGAEGDFLRFLTPYTSMNTGDSGIIGEILGLDRATLLDIAENIDVLFENIDRIIEAARDENRPNFVLTDDEIKQLEEWGKSYRRTQNEINRLQSSEAIKQLELNAQVSDSYGLLSDNQKNFISEFIKSMSGATDSQEAFLLATDDVKAMVEALAKDSASQNIVANLFDSKQAEKSAQEYRDTIIGQISNLSPEIKKLIGEGLTDEEIAIKLGFEINKVEDMKTAIANSLGIDENDPKYQVIVELATNLKTDELTNMQRQIAEATDEAEAFAKALSIDKIFDNKDLVANVRLIKMCIN